MRQADSIPRCTQCGSAEIDEAGACKVCGYADAASTDRKPRLSPEHDEDPPAAESFASGSVRESAPSDMPEWRRELARRLREIKQKREDTGVGLPPAEMLAGAPAQEKNDLHRAEPGLQDAPAADSGSSGRAPETEAPAGSDATAEQLRSLIDRMVRREAANDREEPWAAPPPPLGPAKEGLQDLAAESDRLILLSRAFSGLVDWVLVVLMASALIYAVDVIEGIEIFDTVSLLYYLALLIAVFLCYSVFFLASANQTIGMMITDMRIISERGGRATLGQVFVRALAFLPSLLAAGAGLIAGLLDSQSRCLHDRLSRTRVVRI